MMGYMWSQLKDRFYNKSPIELKVGLLGLDNAGKTTILYKLKNEERSEQIVPTIGFNVEAIHYGKYLLNIWDISGSKPKTRTLWQYYNQNTKLMIFVIDSADIKRLSQAFDELRWLWWHHELAHANFLIYANKQDLINALNAREIVNVLKLDTLTNHAWTVQECCALTGVGLWQGIQQLLQLHEEHSKTCSIRLTRH